MSSVPCCTPQCASGAPLDPAMGNVKRKNYNQWFWGSQGSLAPYFNSPGSLAPPISTVRKAAEFGVSETRGPGFTDWGTGVGILGCGDFGLLTLGDITDSRPQQCF